MSDVTEDYQYCLFAECEWGAEEEGLTDILHKHFSLKGKSGGGDCQILQISSNLFSILFKSEQVRDRVLARNEKITMAGSKVALKLYLSLPESTVPDKVHNPPFSSNKETISIASCNVCRAQIQIPTEAVYSDLLVPHFLKSLRDDCTAVQFKFDKSTLMLQIKGTPESVSSTKSEVHCALKRLKHKEINMAPALITYLRSRRSEEASRFYFLPAEVFATIDILSDNRLVINGLSDYDVKRAEEILMKDIISKEVSFHDEAASVVRTTSFENFVEKLNRIHTEVHIIIVKSMGYNDKKAVCILAGRKTQLCSVEKKIQEFIQEQSKGSVHVLLDGGLELTQSLPLLLGRLGLSHLTGHIRWDAHMGLLELTGTQKVIDETLTVINEKTKGLQRKTVTICRPGAYSYFKADGQEFLNSLDPMLSCLAVLNTEPGSLDLQAVSVMKRNSHGGKSSGFSFGEHDQNMTLISNDVIIAATVSEEMPELCDIIISPLCRSVTGSKILNAAGPKVKTELARTVRRNAITLTGPGNLPCRLLVHVPCLCGSRAKEYLKDAIQECQKRKFKSITIVLDLKELHESFDKHVLTEDLIQTALRTMGAEESISILLAQEELFQALKTAANSIYNQMYALQCMELLFIHVTPFGILGCLNNISKSENDPDSLHRHSSLCEPAVIHLFSKEHQLLNKAKDAIEKHYAGFLSTEVAIWPYLRTCDKQVLSEIHLLQKKHGVNVIVENGTALFNGLAVKTSVAKQEAVELIKKESDSKQLEHKSQVFRNIQWVISNEKVGDINLSCEESYDVEVQYMFQQKSINVMPDNKEFTINVTDMTAINKETSQKHSVVRKERLVGNFPGKWCLTQKENFKKVTLDIESLEYLFVERRFNETLSSKIINKIERIENRSLWKHFSLDVSREVKLLFYGLRHVDVGQVERNGFFRPPETFFSSEYAQGRGIYFYVDASTAQRKCEVDNRQQKVMFLGRVQTGHFTVGRKGINAPPPVDPSHPGVLYNSVVDNKDKPSIFVLFNSDRAYPEYCITFSDGS